MKRRQQEIETIFEPCVKRVKIEPRAIGAGDDGIKMDIRLYLCGKCKKLFEESAMRYNVTLKHFLCNTCDGKG